jgi:hypothetical protein
MLLVNDFIKSLWFIMLTTPPILVASPIDVLGQAHVTLQHPPTIADFLF